MLVQISHKLEFLVDAVLDQASFLSCPAELQLWTNSWCRLNSSELFENSSKFQVFIFSLFQIYLCMLHKNYFEEG